MREEGRARGQQEERQRDRRPRFKTPPASESQPPQLGRNAPRAPAHVLAVLHHEARAARAAGLPGAAVEREHEDEGDQGQQRRAADDGQLALADVLEERRQLHVCFFFLYLKGEGGI